MLFALTLEKDPLRFLGLPSAFLSWVQDVGGFAAAGLAIWLLFTLITQGTKKNPRAVFAKRTEFWLKILIGPLGLVLLRGARNSPWAQNHSPVTIGLFVFFTGWAFVCYLILGAMQLPDLVHWYSSTGPSLRVPTPFQLAVNYGLMTISGACALIAVLIPMVAEFPRLSLRRILAIARLSFKEAIRRKVLWAFSILLLLFLFASWFIDTKPEKQLATYVSVVFLVLALMLLVVAVFLSSFSLPTDIRNNTIHTVLTKPVEKFEVVVGRFLGITALLTLVLVVATGLSLLYVLREIDQDAADESLKAREPLFGEIFFEGTPDPRKGESVGREWEYRGYISGPNPPSPTQYAVWNFDSLPGRLGKRKNVRCEFTFDIFRTTKGRDNTAVTCTFFFETYRFRDELRSAYHTKRRALREAANADPIEVIDEKLAEEFGYYEAPSVSVSDFHTLSVDIPASLIRNALENDEARRQELRGSSQQYIPLRVRVRCDDRTQYIGMAKYDLYFRVDDHEGKTDRLWFSWNFFKGAAGLWFLLCLGIGVALTMSTYLSGVITLLCTGFLIFMGYFQDFIATLAYGTNFGGGPMESMLRLFKGQNQVAPLDDTAASRVAATSDVALRWVLRRVLNVLPDVDRFSLTEFVAEGFNISGEQLLMGFVLLTGYLLPWAILAYYLIRAREIAAPT